MQTPEKINDRIFIIDDFDLDRKERTGTYVIMEKELTLIETSASPSIPFILSGLKQLHIDPTDIKYIIVTHIHLDHAGGAGLLLEHCPNAKVVVHPKGARHIIDPARLIAGARAVYGEKFDKLFNPILPIPEEKVIIKNDGDTLQISETCKFTFLDTPGHANHHFSIYDPISNGIFTGDTIGVYYPELKHDGIELYLPSTSPNQFNPDYMLQSLEKIEKLNVDTIYFGHYGASSNIQEVSQQIRSWLPLFLEAGNKGMAVQGSLTEKVEVTTKALFEYVTEHLSNLQVPSDHPVFGIINIDLPVCAMGLIDYLSKKA